MFVKNTANVDVNFSWSKTEIISIKSGETGEITLEQFEYLTKRIGYTFLQSVPAPKSELPTSAEVAKEETYKIEFASADPMQDEIDTIISNTVGEVAEPISIADTANEPLPGNFFALKKYATEKGIVVTPIMKKAEILEALKNLKK
jgi:hypothetical protein